MFYYQLYTDDEKAIIPIYTLTYKDKQAGQSKVLPPTQHCIFCCLHVQFLSDEIRYHKEDNRTNKGHCHLHRDSKYL